MRSIGVKIFVLASVASCIIGGCHGEKKSAGQVPPPIVRTAEKGPVKLTVTLDRNEAPVAWPLTLSIDAVAQNGVTVTLPNAGKTLGDLVVTRTVTDPDIPTPDAAARQWKRTMTLESYTSGEKNIPAIHVKFTDSRDPKKPIKSDLSTEAFKVKITSLIQGKADPYKPRDIKGAVELTPQPDYTWVWLTLGTLVGVAIALLAVRYFIRRKIMRALTAGEWAMRQLNILEGEHLPQAGLVEKFYVRLTLVVRQYIERRFGIAAPKLTTREFLEKVQDRHVVGDTDRESLQKFLSAADMVKFAQFTPSADEVNSSFDTARNFISQTAARNEQEVKS